MLALHATAFDVRHAAVRQRRAAARRRCRCRSRRSSGMPTTRRAGARGSRRRHAAGPSRRGHAGGARGALPAGRRADRDDAEAAAPSSQSPEYLPYGIAFDVEKLTWEMDFFIKHFIEAYRGVVISSNVRGRAARGIRRVDRGTGRGAAGPVPPRLSQPQPDAPRGPAVHHRLPGRAHGAGHLRSRVAAARLLRRSAGTDRERADRLLPGAEGRHRPRSGLPRSGST